MSEKVKKAVVDIIESEEVSEYFEKILKAQTEEITKIIQQTQESQVLERNNLIEIQLQKEKEKNAALRKLEN